jgi:hypothetical protein
MSEIIQGPLLEAITSPDTSSGFTDQLTLVSGYLGTVTFTQVTGTPDLIVDSGGAVSTVGVLLAGTYIATGTTADSHSNTGTFTYTLRIYPSYSIVGTPSGGVEATITIQSNTADDFGSYWFLDGDVTGWDSPDMRVTMLTKIGNDVNAEGEVPSDLHYRGRSLVLKVYAECESEEARENSRLLLAQAANTYSCVFTANEVIAKYMNVVRSGNTNLGKLAMVDKGYPGKAADSGSPIGWGFAPGTTVWLLEATIELFAQDPFKYGVTPVTGTFAGGTMAITNPGTYPSENGVIALSATGGGTGPITLATPERTLSLVVPVLPVGTLSDIPAELTVDLYQKLIYDTAVGPAANFYFLRDLRTPWLRIPTGTTSLTVSPSQAGTLTFQPSWL